jgi:hypothetical protein
MRILKRAKSECARCGKRGESCLLLPTRVIEYSTAMRSKTGRKENWHVKDQVRKDLASPRKKSRRRIIRMRKLQQKAKEPTLNPK